MASSYEEFLERQNRDYSGEQPQPEVMARGVKAMEKEIPPAIKALGEQRFYVSDTDAPFVPVEVPYGKSGFPGADELEGLLDAKGEIEVVEVKEWDPKGEYADVVEAVDKAVKGGMVKVVRIENGSRVLYLVLGVDEERGMVVGVKADAVES